MAREKFTTLYSRNSVKIGKTTNIDQTKLRSDYRNAVIITETISYDGNAPIPSKYNEGKYIEVRKESKLGFWYTCKKWQYGSHVGGTTNRKSIKTKKITVNFDTNQYVLSYPIEYAGTKISIEERPWDIAPGSKGMPNHFIDALVKETNKFFDIIVDNKLGIYNDSKNPITVAELKKQVFIDLFGYEDGPKTQMNDIKILSHGFDLKESFRKRKEIK